MSLPGGSAPPTNDDPSRTPPVRASDAEREDTVRLLHRAMVEGRLDPVEADERVAAAYAARYRDDLVPLLADLPSRSAARDAAPSWSAIWTSLVWRARLTAVGPDAQAPSARQCRLAVVIAVVASLWVVLCALFGAAVVTP